jgi:hypothetical protein
VKLVFRYEGNTPSKKNQKRIAFRRAPGGGKGQPFILPSHDHKKWHTEALILMKRQRSAVAGVVFPIARCKRVYGRLFYGDLRGRDSSNTWESIMDLLVDAEILADDAWAITGPTAQFPELRRDAPGWEIVLEIADPAPGHSEEHRYQQVPKV